MKPTARRRRDRRALLDHLLTRALRGRLTTPEAALLVETVRAEQRAYDQTRASLGETTAALTRHRAAADAAIREAEQRAEDAERRHVEALAEQQHVEAGDTAALNLAGSTATAWKQRAEDAEAAVDRVRALAADMRTWASPRGIATQYADDIERALAGERWCGHEAGCGCTAERAVTVAPGVAVIHDRAAEQRRRNLAAILAKPADTPFAELTEYAAQCLTGAGERITAAEQRAEEAVQALAAASQRLAAQHDAHETRRHALAKALSRDPSTTWPDLIEHATEAHQWATSAAVKADRKRAEQAEADAERFKADYLNACQTIAAMHEAATGRTGEGPVRGVVEDVADVRARAEEAEQRLDAQHETHEARRRHLADALAVDDATTWPRLVDIARTAAHLAQRTEQVEADLDRVREERERALDLAAARGDALAAHLARTRSTEPTEPCTPATAGPDHPIHALLDALTTEHALDRADAVDLTSRYHDAIHDAYCTRPHRAPRPADRARLAEPVEEEQPEPAKPAPAPLNHPIPLAQPCASCGHNRNHHPFGGPCCVGNTENRCGCPVFTVTADSLTAEAEPAACNSYLPPTASADSGLCARCGMYDYKHAPARP